ncbi:hypothetical protein UCRPC4_g04475 [Phaeomoniella chlamydospora]|uniref:SWR1-complex protein 3 domain-containing protein n=1 Tax=Phaeomoniella chlamydospora TaxID=158046 RepID=A0A0G2E917_PHACM|nr:hypothetical protein UCRPC4_g04475 [Phaeomoniella chlamydospora]
MAEGLPQKRVLPPRERRESTAKRRAASPVATPAKNATAKGSTPRSTPKSATSKSQKKKAVESTPTRETQTPVVEEILPSRIPENQPLPIVRTKQPEDLSIEEYQSIAESAVLVASLAQSRTKWLMDEMFTKYWQKPSKKKGEPPIQQPDAKSMTKLGPCTMIIEPHKFEVMVYTVKDPNAPAVQYRPPKPPPTAYYPPPQSYPGYANSPAPGTPIQARPPYSSYPPPQVKQEPGRSKATPPTQTNQAPRPPPQQPPPRNSVAPAPNARPVNSAPPPNRPPGNNNAESEKNPVVQKLATAAASDPALKQLMQVVASSRATQEQLRTFQGHIDRLNAIIARENAEAAQKQKGEAVHRQSPAIPQPQPPTPLNSSAVNRPTSIPSATPISSTPVKKEPNEKLANIPAPPNSISTPQPGPSSATPMPQPIPQAGPPPRATPATPVVGSPHPNSQNNTPAPRAIQSLPTTSTPTPQPPYPQYGAPHVQRQPTPRQSPHLPQQPQQPYMPYSTPTQPQSKPSSQPTMTAHPYPYPQPLYATHYPAPRPPPQTQQPPPKHIVFENLSPLTSLLPASSTRYLFPEHAVLDFSPSKDGTIILASFFVLRTGAQILSPYSSINSSDNKTLHNEDSSDSTLASLKSYYSSPQAEYYQPVTMRLIANNPLVLETIARAAKPLKAVQDHMQNIIKTKKRARQEILALRLPREEFVEKLKEQRENGAPPDGLIDKITETPTVLTEKAGVGNTTPTTKKSSPRDKDSNSRAARANARARGRGESIDPVGTTKEEQVDVNMLDTPQQEKGSEKGRLNEKDDANESKELEINEAEDKIEEYEIQVDDDLRDSWEWSPFV